MSNTKPEPDMIPVISNVEHCPGVCAPACAIVTLRSGVILEINDEGINAYESVRCFGRNDKIVGTMMFKTPAK